MIQQDRIIELDREDHIKDLGVIFDENLDVGMHIAERINKAYSMLWLIKRNIKDIGREAITGPNRTYYAHHFIFSFTF